MLNFDARVKNSDSAQPRVTNVKTPNLAVDLAVFCSLSAHNLARLQELQISEERGCME